MCLLLIRKPLEIITVTCEKENFLKACLFCLDKYPVLVNQVTSDKSFAFLVYLGHH